MEPRNLLDIRGGDDKRPDWALYGVSSNPPTQAFDLSIVDPVCSSVVASITVESRLTKTGLVRPLAATLGVEKKKQTKYGNRCRKLGIEFFPFVMDAYGGATKKVQQLCSSWCEDTALYHRALLDECSLLDVLRIVLIKAQYRMFKEWSSSVAAAMMHNH